MDLTPFNKIAVHRDRVVTLIIGRKWLPLIEPFVRKFRKQISAMFSHPIVELDVLYRVNMSLNVL